MNKTHLRGTTKSTGRKGSVRAVQVAQRTGPTHTKPGPRPGGAPAQPAKAKQMAKGKTYSPKRKLY